MAPPRPSAAVALPHLITVLAPSLLFLAVLGTTLRLPVAVAEDGRLAGTREGTLTAHSVLIAAAGVTNGTARLVVDADGRTATLYAPGTGAPVALQVDGDSVWWTVRATTLQGTVTLPLMLRHR